MLPKYIVDIIGERGHLRNLEKLMARDCPKILGRLLSKYPSFNEGVYLELGNERGRCVSCKKPTRFVNFVAGYKTFCGNECRASSPIVSKKRKETCLKRFGTTSPMGSEKVKERFKATMVERYGVEWAMQSEENRMKSIATCLQKYGVRHHVETKEFIDSMRAKAHEIQAKREATFHLRYGRRSPLQVPEIFEQQQRTAQVIKTEIIGGVKFGFRGYEGVVIKFLVSRGIDPKRIVNRSLEGLQSVKYLDPRGKERYYLPDIWIKGTKQLVEVKSTRTLGIDHQPTFDWNLRKFKAVQKAGYDLWLAVSDGRKKVVFFKNPRSRKTIESKLTESGIRFQSG